MNLPVHHCGSGTRSNISAWVRASDIAEGLALSPRWTAQRREETVITGSYRLMYHVSQTTNTFLLSMKSKDCLSHGWSQC